MLTAFYPDCPVLGYERWRCLYRVIATADLDMREPVFSLVTTNDLSATAAIVERLRKVLAKLDRQYANDHYGWEYNKHIAVLQALKAEEWIESRQLAALARRAA